MNCYDAQPWLNALLDGELNKGDAADLRVHLADCGACMKRYRTLEALRDGLRRAGMHYDVPESLRRKVEAVTQPPRSALASSSAISHTPDELGASPEQPRRRATQAPWRAASARPRAIATRWLLWAGWPVAIAASALLAVNLGDRRADFQSEVVAAHVRSLLADHLSDVVSSNHHTVKPWFTGKLDFSPPVPDLSSQGFDLVGGRLEYLDHRLAAAIVYRKHAHVINVLVRPANARTPGLPRASVHNGYALRAWRTSEFDVIAISDLDPTELERFERAYRSQKAPD